MLISFLHIKRRFMLTFELKRDKLCKLKYHPKTYLTHKNKLRYLD